MVAVVNGAVAGAILVMVVAMRGGLSLATGAVLAAGSLLVSCGLQFWYLRAQWAAIE